MGSCDRRWALVLAAGEGRRLRGLTTTYAGIAIPKQFCALERGPSLLQEALRRARSVVSADRICTIVAAQHRRWWADQLDSIAPANVIVQPHNRGTAHGILLPLLMILERDPQARIVLLPSDHHVREEARLARSLRQAVGTAGAREAPIVLLGLEPRSADSQLGYVVPRPDDDRRYRGVERFVEKPEAPLAAALIEHGALWNAFIIAAEGKALVELYERRCPDVVAAMRESLGRADRDAALAALYDELREVDFSRDILQGEERSLRVLAAPECGWSDLGTPERVGEALQALPGTADPRDSAPAQRPALLSLAAQHRRLLGAAAALPAP
jgi:mannose-1-phosphate guanylyltransferase